MTKRTALVIGVGAEIGLGAALCRRFASAGLHVLIAGRTPSKLENVATSIVAAGGSAEAVTMDTTKEADVVELFDRAMAPANSREAPELIVYNAGGNQKVDFRELSAELFEQFWRVGCFGGFLVGREAARRLVPLGRGLANPSASAQRLDARARFATFQRTCLKGSR